MLWLLAQPTLENGQRHKFLRVGFKGRVANTTHYFLRFPKRTPEVVTVKKTLFKKVFDNQVRADLIFWHLIAE